MFYHDKCKVGNDSRSLPLQLGGLRGAVSSPVGPGQSPVWGPGDEALEDLEILQFTVPRRSRLPVY